MLQLSQKHPKTLQKLEYSALSSVKEVMWKAGQKETVFNSVDAIITAEESGRIEINETGIILNIPQIVGLMDN